MNLSADECGWEEYPSVTSALENIFWRYANALLLSNNYLDRSAIGLEDLK